MKRWRHISIGFGAALLLGICGYTISGPDPLFVGNRLVVEDGFICLSEATQTVPPGTTTLMLAHQINKLILSGSSSIPTLSLLGDHHDQHLMATQLLFAGAGTCTLVNSTGTAPYTIHLCAGKDWGPAGAGSAITLLWDGNGWYETPCYRKP